MPTPPPAKKSDTGAIVGGVVGGLAVIVVAAAAVFFLCARGRKHAATQPTAAVPGAEQDATKRYKNDSESMSPHSQVSGWGSASPSTLNDAMFRHPDPRMSPQPMSGTPAAGMYMPQPVHQVPVSQTPVQPYSEQQYPGQQYSGQEAYRPPNGGVMELGSSN
jgi:hypothetical protein